MGVSPDPAHDWSVRQRGKLAASDGDCDPFHPREGLGDYLLYFTTEKSGLFDGLVVQVEVGSEEESGDSLHSESSLRGLPLVRFAGSYLPWLVQRTLDAYRALELDERKQVDEAIAGTGWEPVLAHLPRHRLFKRDFKLFLETP